MTKFKVGDKFIPRKPKDANEYPGWAEEMDKYDGKVLTVSFVNDQNNICTSETSYTFSPNWCEKVGEHTVPTNKTIDWEQRRYEIAKELMAAQINSLYLKNKGWCYEDEARYAVDAADVLIKQLQESSEN